MFLSKCAVLDSKNSRFVPEIHLRQPRFTYSACRAFTKNKETRTSLLSIGYGDFKNVSKRTTSDKILYNKEFNITKNPKYYGYQRGLSSLIYKFFDKKSPGCGFTMEIMLNQQFAKELHKPIIRKLENEKYNHLLLTIFGVLILLICN